MTSAGTPVAFDEIINLVVLPADKKSLTKNNVSDIMSKESKQVFNHSFAYWPTQFWRAAS